MPSETDDQHGAQTATHDQLSIAATLHATVAEMQELADRLYGWGWLDTTGGSFSIRVPGHPDQFAMTPTHSAFDRWRLVESGLTVVDEQLRLSPLSTGAKRLHPSAIIHQRLYQRLDGADAIIHTHSPHLLAFACAGRDIEPATLHSQILGTVPCLGSDADSTGDAESRATRYLDEIEQEMTTGMAGYQYALEHFRSLLDQIDERIAPRAAELRRHGLAFTVYRHGIFVVARRLDEAFDNLIRVERSAQVQLLAASLPSK